MIGASVRLRQYGVMGVIGFGYPSTQTPIGRNLNRSAREQDRPAVFAAQFALSPACWLVSYPLAEWLGSVFGLATTAVALAVIGGVALVLVLRLWPALDPAEIEHVQADLPFDHPHLRDHPAAPHHHALVIDDLTGAGPRVEPMRRSPHCV